MVAASETRFSSSAAFRPLLILAAMLISMSTIARNADAADRLVLMEKYSASWCPHCMNSSRVIDSLIDANPSDKFVTFDAFIATSGNYWTDWGVDRGFNFYNVQSYPTVVFDGALGHAGDAGGNDVLLQSEYQQLVDQRAAVPTDLMIDMVAMPQANGTYRVTTSVSIEQDGTQKSMRNILLQALDNYGLYDDGVTLPHNTVMQVIEADFDHSLGPGQTQKFTRTLTLDSTSEGQFEDIRLISWAQAAPGEGSEVFNAGEILLSLAHPADLNHDGIIDGGDFDYWENEFGVRSFAYQSADGTGDGAVDGADMLLSQRHFGVEGNNPAATAAVADVPEPAAAGLLLCGIAASAGLIGRLTRRLH